MNRVPIIQNRPGHEVPPPDFPARLAESLSPISMPQSGARFTLKHPVTRQ